MGQPQPQDLFACSEGGGTVGGTDEAGNVGHGSPRSLHDRSAEPLVHSGDEAIVRDFPIASADTGRVRAYSSTAVDTSKANRRDEVGRFRVSHTDFPDDDPFQTNHGGVEDGTSQGVTNPTHFASNENLQPRQQYHHQQMGGSHDGGAESLVAASGDCGVVAGRMHTDGPSDVNCTPELPDERGSTTEGHTGDTVLDPSQRSVLEEWLRDVEQETETAATALKVCGSLHRGRVHLHT